jgi:hypothetical protein
MYFNARCASTLFNQVKGIGTIVALSFRLYMSSVHHFIVESVAILSLYMLMIEHTNATEFKSD